MPCVKMDSPMHNFEAKCFPQEDRHCSWEARPASQKGVKCWRSPLWRSCLSVGGAPQGFSFGYRRCSLLCRGPHPAIATKPGQPSPSPGCCSFAGQLLPGPAGLSCCPGWRACKHLPCDHSRDFCVLSLIHRIVTCVQSLATHS